MPPACEAIKIDPKPPINIHFQSPRLSPSNTLPSQPEIDTPLSPPGSITGMAAAEAKVPNSAKRTLLPYSFARNQGILLMPENGQLKTYYREGSLTPWLLSEVRRYCRAPLPKPQAIGSEEFQKQLTECYQKDGGEASRVAADMDNDADLAQLAEEIPESTDLMEGDNDAPVVRLINAVLAQAVREQVSDIHIETFEENVSIRFRSDGVLREVLAPKRQLAPLLVSRLKVMARLDIAEKRIPQDGRISVRVAGHTVDIRLSTIPSAHGERIVMRLLDTGSGRLSVGQLGISEQGNKDFMKALHSPHGIILVTGPTGSGKTTTLYAGITEINESTRNIMTIEDPVEYMLEGIAQTQVNNKVDMTFARGLRAILRQDPDVVMIGEIRDLETAEIAVQASLTGHLVLSTLHTNSAVGAIPRLRDIGVESFLLSSSLIVLIAQRLVRRLCPACHQLREATSVDKLNLNLKEDADISLYHAVGCNECNQVGFRGRTAIYEIVPIDDRMREMIHKNLGEQEITKYARTISSGIFEDGREKVLAGVTTVEELLRVSLAH